MIYKLYGDTYAVRLERGEEVVASIAELCEKEGIRAGTVQGLGAADDATVGLYSKMCIRDRVWTVLFYGRNGSVFMGV